MIRQGVFAFVAVCAFIGSLTVPVQAANVFYVRIQGPKPVRAQAPGHGGGAAIGFENNVALGSATGGLANGKTKSGEITITKAPANAAPMSTSIAETQAAKPLGSSPPLIRETVTVGCSGFDVAADFGKGPVRGVLASQSVDGLCIFAVPMSAQTADAIVRVGLSGMPPGWSFNSQPQSKCIRSGDTLDGSLAETQSIFSFQWSLIRPVALGGPCGKT